MAEGEPGRATHTDLTETLVSDTLSAVPSEAGLASGISHEVASGSGVEAGVGAGSSAGESGTRRSQFESEELAVVMSHYDIGPIDRIKPFPRGSRKSPKVVLKSAFGLFLLKRRAKGKEDPRRVAFCHMVQLHLMDKGFPLPKLLGTRRDNNSMLKLDGKVYELFEFVRGNAYDQSAEATHDGGRVLATMHRLLGDFECAFESSSGSFHGSQSVRSALEHAPLTLRRVYGDAVEERAERIVEGLEYLKRAYRDAAGRVTEAGLDGWPASVVHSDFHPGNLLYRGTKAVAVIDFDSARRLPRVVDVANGALQFSIVGGRKPAEWPEHLDEARFRRFVAGYGSVTGGVLSEEERSVVVPLMVEALIAEVAVPIAQAGRFGSMSGIEVFDVVGRKVRWLLANEARLVEVLAS
ncbi:MAG: phosphotransferase [Planctomycetota bacterium]